VQPVVAAASQPKINSSDVAPTTNADQQESLTVQGVIQKVSPAVVTVYNKVTASNAMRNGTGNNFGNGNNGNNGNNGSNGSSSGTSGSQQYVTQGIGTGVIFDQQGYIVTNNHVVEGAQEVEVAYNDGRQLVTAKVVGTDKIGDIAVLKVEGPLPAVASFGDSSKLQVGQTVIAIGAALGDFRNSATKGIVSGVNRSLQELGTTDVFIQTDTPINHGNSGGPLLDLNGNIVGINTAVLRTTPGIGNGSDAVAEGLGFAIPSNTVKYLVDQLISNGKVSRPYFGIQYQMITPADAGAVDTTTGQNLPKVEGALIAGTRNGSGVVANGPADKAGLKDNDVITAIDGTQLDDNNPLASVLQNYKPGDTVKLTVQRGSQTLTLDLTLGTRPDSLN
jgi:2-alkenal reductase